MKVRVFHDKPALARAAASQAAEVMRQAILARGTARILATADNSESELLAALVREAGITWSEVELFHVSEFVGLGVDHPASHRRFLFERLIHPTRLGRYHLLDGQNDLERTSRRAGEAIAVAAIDVAFAALGPNGQLAFQSGPADFATEKPYLIVGLDDLSRSALVNENGFATLAEVPERAIAISIRQLLKAHTIVCVAQDALTSEAVRRCVEGPISPLAPASILRTHPNTTLYLDVKSAALLAAPPLIET